MNIADYQYFWGRSKHKQTLIKPNRGRLSRKTLGHHCVTLSLLLGSLQTHTTETQSGTFIHVKTTDHPDRGSTYKRSPYRP